MKLVGCKRNIQRCPLKATIPIFEKNTELKYDRVANLKHAVVSESQGTFSGNFRKNYNGLKVGDY